MYNSKKLFVILSLLIADLKAINGSLMPYTPESHPLLASILDVANEVRKNPVIGSDTMTQKGKPEFREPPVDREGQTFGGIAGNMLCSLCREKADEKCIKTHCWNSENYIPSAIESLRPLVTDGGHIGAPLKDNTPSLEKNIIPVLGQNFDFRNQLDRHDLLQLAQSNNEQAIEQLTRHRDAQAPVQVQEPTPGKIDTPPVWSITDNILSGNVPPVQHQVSFNDVSPGNTLHEHSPVTSPDVAHIHAEPVQGNIIPESNNNADILSGVPLPGNVPAEHVTISGQGPAVNPLPVLPIENMAFDQTFLPENHNFVDTHGQTDGSSHLGQTVGEPLIPAVPLSNVQNMNIPQEAITLSVDNQPIVEPSFTGTPVDNILSNGEKDVPTNTDNFQLTDAMSLPIPTDVIMQMIQSGNFLGFNTNEQSHIPTPLTLTNADTFPQQENTGIVVDSLPGNPTPVLTVAEKSPLSGEQRHMSHGHVDVASPVNDQAMDGSQVSSVPVSNVGNMDVPPATTHTHVTDSQPIVKTPFIDQPVETTFDSHTHGAETTFDSHTHGAETTFDSHIHGTETTFDSHTHGVPKAQDNLKPESDPMSLTIPTDVLIQMLESNDFIGFNNLEPIRNDFQTQQTVHNSIKPSRGPVIPVATDVFSNLQRTGTGKQNNPPEIPTATDVFANSL